MLRRTIKNSWVLAALWLGLLPVATVATAAEASNPGTPPVPVEVYGRLPSLEEVSLSPDGTRLAFVRTVQDQRVIEVLSLPDGKTLAALRVGDVKLRSVAWADDNDLMLVTSSTSLPWGFSGLEHEWYQLQIYDLRKHRTIALPNPSTNTKIRLMNVIAGRVMVRHLDGHTVLFVPGIYVQGETLPALIRIDLETGTQRVISEGSRDTREWLVDADGEIIAEQDYDGGRQRWAMKLRRNGRLQEAVSGREAIDVPQLLGFGLTTDTLLMQVIEDGNPVWKLLSLQDGTFGPPMAERRMLQAPIEDRLTYRLIGGMHIDDAHHYVFFDPSRQTRWNEILRTFRGERVRLESASDDFTKLIVRVDGPTYGFKYELIDLSAHTARTVGDVYRGIASPLEVRRITYAAADGVQIPAYLTLPRGRDPAKLPLIVLPHGGPAVRDTADFDWWSQALAEQGYAVLRPNYRGTSIDRRFVVAGFGEWGRKMQTDLSDGVRYLVKEGIADPGRVCIVGASYGGYAALAGVSLDPGVYRCAVSVAGISDLKRMLNWVDEKHLERSNAEQRFWDRFMGVSGPDDKALEMISPIKHLDVVNVPVLLIHGKDDTVVPFEQSDAMFDALRHAKKDVELLTLKREDHWLSRSETRLQMLQASIAFLRAHNPPDAP
jgi:dipeptidyl aminopeptidase/acylaminoacyl peptidase